MTTDQRREKRFFEKTWRNVYQSLLVEIARENEIDIRRPFFTRIRSNFSAWFYEGGQTHAQKELKLLQAKLKQNNINYEEHYKQSITHKSWACRISLFFESIFKAFNRSCN